MSELVKLVEFHEYKPPKPKPAKAKVIPIQENRITEDEFVQQEYERDRQLRNLFSYWFPKVEGIDGFNIPESKIIMVPPEVFGFFVCDNVTKGAPVIKKFVEETIIPEMAGRFQWFMKNGCFSNKFDFEHSVTEDLKVLADFTAIQYASVCLNTGGVSEIVLREIIPWNNRKTACIYGGMPLRPELRVFYDFDSNEVLFSENYWDYRYVRPSLYDRTDAIVFEAVHDELELICLIYRDRVEEDVAVAMQGVELEGKWSVDVLIDDAGKLWLIDMALAERSAYWRG